MFELKGLYEWKLIDVDTGNVDQEGSQPNLTSDIFLMAATNMFRYSNSDGKLSVSQMKIQISDSTQVAGVDYRRWGASNLFNNLEETGAISVHADSTVNSIDVNNNPGFSPPAAPRTVRIIGVALTGGTFVAPRPNFASFVELSTPITQNTNQYFYIKYTLYFSFTSGGNNVPSNRYIDRSMTKTLLYNGPSMFGAGRSTDPIYSGLFLRACLTSFLPPSNINKVMRDVPVLFANTNADILGSGAYDSTYTPSFGVRAQTVTHAFAISDMSGPVGSLCFSNLANLPYYSTFCGPFIFPSANADPNKYYSNITYGYTQVKDMSASVSRIFCHPASRISQVFSDPSFPPSSNGNISITGTPTQKYPMIGRVKITKTGDASDIIDEAFTADSTADQLLVTQQDWTNNDIVLLSNSGGSLPSPLIPSTDYYVVDATGITPNVKIRLSLSQGGSPIDMSDDGYGDSTISRQNTGRWAYELEPWYFSAQWPYNLNQINMGIDIDNKVQPQNLFSINDTGEDGTAGTYYLTDCLVRAYAKIGDYVYTVQASRYNRVNNMCRWYFNSIETSEALCKFGDASTIIRKMEQVGTRLYIATNDGLYRYDTTSPATAPSLLTVMGILDNNPKDVVYDSTTGYLWTGHGVLSSYTADLSSDVLTTTDNLNISTGVPVRVSNSGGTFPSPLDATTTYYAINIAANQIKVAASYADATNNNPINIGTNGTPTNYVQIVGLSKISLDTTTATRYVPGTGEQLQGMSTDDAWIMAGQLDAYNGRVLRAGSAQLDTGWYSYQNNWILQDGTGWYKFRSIGSDVYGHVAALRKNTTNIALRDRTSVFLYDATVTGMGTGSSSTIETFSGETSYFLSQMVQLSSNRFGYFRWGIISTGLILSDNYVIGTGINTTTGILPKIVVPLTLPWVFSQTRNAIDVDGVGNYLSLWLNFPITSSPGIPSLYGYTGGTWVKDSTTEINIKKTGSQALLSGISATFNNATGKLYTEQFVLGERFTFVYAPYKVKDNLQTMQMSTRFYHCDAHPVDSSSYTIATPYTYHIPEQSNINFRDMDNQDFVTEVYKDTTRFSAYAVPDGSNFTVDCTTNILTIGMNIPTGTVVGVLPQDVSGVRLPNATYYLPWPLYPDGLYYAINVDTTRVRLASTYADATLGNAIDIQDTGFGTHTIKQVAPTANTYYAGINGIFAFSPANAGSDMTLRYTYTLFN